MTISGVEKQVKRRRKKDGWRWLYGGEQIAKEAGRVVRDGGRREGTRKEDEKMTKKIGKEE
jgi:hypothetical protein